MGFVRQLHVDFLSGETGEHVVGILGLILLFLGLSGIYIWWPKRRGIPKSLKLERRKGSRIFHLGLHRLS